MQPPLTDRPAERLLLVGWDGAEISLLQSLLGEGRLPNLAALVERGILLPFAIPRPALSVAAWTSLATGGRPDEHGVLHSQFVSDDRLSLLAVTRANLQCRPLWQLLGDAGLCTHVVGWPVTYPAEGVNGVCVSDVFLVPATAESRAHAIGSTVYPPQAAGAASKWYTSPREIEDMLLNGLIHSGADSLREFSRFESSCRSLLAESDTLFRATRWCLERGPWDFSACVFPGLRRAHALAAWLRTAHADGGEFADHLLTGCYADHDFLLGQLIQEAGDDAHVMAITVTGAATKGIATISGPRVRVESATAFRSAQDLVPAVLTMFGLNNVAEPRAGEPEDQGSRRATSQRSIDQDLAWPEPGPSDYPENVQHLVELGYTDPNVVAAEEAVRQHQRTWATNRAASLLDGGLVQDAIAVLEPVVQAEPKEINARLLLAEAYCRAGQYGAARQVLDWLLEHGIESPSVYFMSATILAEEREYDSALVDLRCAQRSGKPLPNAGVFEGRIHMRRRDYLAAKRAFAQSLEQDGPAPPSYDGLAAAEIQLGNFEEAAEHALEAVSGDMRYGLAHYHLAIALIRLGRPQDAIRAFDSWSTVEPTAGAPYRWRAHLCRQSMDDPDRAAEYARRGREVVRQRRAQRTTATVRPRNRG